MSKIVILDAYTSNPGDLDWSSLESLGELTLHDRTAPSEVVERLKGAQIALSNKVVLDRSALEALPELRYIGVLATGYNVIDIEAAAEKDIAVCNVPGYSTASVSQMVMSHLLHLCQNVSSHADSVRRGEWVGSKDFCYSLTPQMELEGKIMGIVGLGQTGLQTAKLAQAFGMEVVGYSRTPKGLPGIRDVSIDELFGISDVISLHCPLTPQTEHLVNAERLKSMKTSSFLINTGRGPLVDEAALAAALEAGEIAGAGLDVLGAEPGRPDQPLMKAPNCHITPHIAWATREARRRLIEMATANVAAFLAGETTNRVY